MGLKGHEVRSEFVKFLCGMESRLWALWFLVDLED